MSYQPTDEQVEAVARHSYPLDDWDSTLPANRTLFVSAARRNFESAAFQAIIRAAQAEAWGEGVTHSFQTIEAPIVYDAAIFADNPYREAPTA